MRTKKSKTTLWGGALAFVGLALAVLVWVIVQGHRPPPGTMLDLRAGWAARAIENGDERLLKYLELRYGPMSDPAVRQRVFLDFFNVERIQALQFLVRHAPEERRRENVEAMARWVVSYRESLSPEEMAALRDQLQSAEGPATLRRATDQYNAQDVHYRGATAPVISELLRTLHTVQQKR